MGHALENVLNFCYDQGLTGLPGSDTVEKFARSYSVENGSEEEKIDRLIRWQMAKCATTGFVTGLGGAITLPLTIPADTFANYYVLLRMVAAIAIIRGYDPRSEPVRNLAFVCLAGNGAADLVKNAGLQLIRKSGGHRLISLGRIVPFLGGIVGAGVDAATCRMIGNVAKNVFVRTAPKTGAASLA